MLEYLEGQAYAVVGLSLTNEKYHNSNWYFMWKIWWYTINYSIPHKWTIEDQIWSGCGCIATVVWENGG